MKRTLLYSTIVGLGVASGSLLLDIPGGIRVAVTSALSSPKAGAESAAPGGGAAEGEDEESEGNIKMSPEQIQQAKIKLGQAEPGVLGLHIVVPGTVQTDPDRMARIAGRVVGTVAELRKRLGDEVKKGEIVAILDSREVAEAKSEYYAARTNLELQQTLFERDKSLWDKKISAENQYLRSRNTLIEAQLRVQLSIQKLQALGLTDDDIGTLEKRTASLRAGANEAQSAPGTEAPGLQRYSIRSPIAGQVVERLVNLGSPMGGEGESKEVYVVADLQTVWIELAVPTSELPMIKNGQAVQISSGASPASKGRIVFVSPMLNPETRSARVIASVENSDLTWRPGSFVTAQVTAAEERVDLRIARGAVQNIGGEQVVFVRTSEGFEKRVVVLGKSDDEHAEVKFGLDAGETIAITNSFVLKAEVGKAEAKHAH